MASNIFKIISLMLGAACLSYILWIKGYMTVTAKRAAVFIGHRRKNSWGATVTACTGYTKRTLKLIPGKEYRFRIEYETDNGSISVMLSKNRNPLVVLDKEQSQYSFIAEAGLYIITTTFDHASGRYTLFWEEA